MAVTATTVPVHASLIAFRCVAPELGTNVAARLKNLSFATDSEGMYKISIIANTDTIVGGDFSITREGSVMEVNEDITGFTGGTHVFHTLVTVTAGPGNVEASSVDQTDLEAFDIKGLTEKQL